VCFRALCLLRTGCAADGVQHQPPNHEPHRLRGVALTFLDYMEQRRAALQQDQSLDLVRRFRLTFRHGKSSRQPSGTSKNKSKRLQNE